MQKVKKTIKTALAGLLMAGAFAVPASAQTNNCTAEQLAANLCVAVNTQTDNSDNYSVNGDCSAVQVSSGDIEQSQSSSNNGVGGSGVGTGAVGNGTGTGGNGSASSSQSQSATQNSFSADCSTTNTTNVTQASSQVKSPRGGVSAGAGGASSVASTGSILGLLGSVSTMGLGLILRRQGL